MDKPIHFLARTQERDQVAQVFCTQLCAGTSTKVFSLPKNGQSFIKTFPVEHKGEALFSVQWWLTACRAVGRLKEMSPVIVITGGIKESSKSFHTDFSIHMCASQPGE